MIRLRLINPNTSTATTDAMVMIARDAALVNVSIVGATAPFGVSLITNEDQLAVAAEAVLALVRAPEASAVDGVIVAAFGDPGLIQARAALTCPVTGIAEASMAEAGRNGRAFAVVTTTPELADAISAAAWIYGHGRNCLGIWLTEGDPVALTADAARLQEALDAACRRAIAAGAEAVIIGGGPLARAARALAPGMPVPLVEPIPAAIRLAISRATTA